MLKRDAVLNDQGIENRAPALERVAGVPFYNTSPLDLRGVLADDRYVARNLKTYISKFSPSAAEVLQRYRFDEQIKRLDEANLLYLVLSKFADLDLHPDVVDNVSMGYIFEELIRRFSEAANETAGEHFTPREVIRLMVNLLLQEDDQVLRQEGSVRTLYDPACGTGGMLTVAEDYLRHLNPDAQLEVFGQELNPETWAICRSDLMITGHDPRRIVLGNSFSADGHEGERFDYQLANPPFGVEWKKVKDDIDREAQKGFEGRFGAGLPRISDGSLLFLQAHDLQDEAALRTAEVGLRSSSAAHPCVSGSAGVRRVGDSQVDHRERLARRNRGPSRPALLQHWDQHATSGLLRTANRLNARGA